MGTRQEGAPRVLCVVALGGWHEDRRWRKTGLHIATDVRLSSVKAVARACVTVTTGGRCLCYGLGYRERENRSVCFLYSKEHRWTYSQRD